MCGLAWGITDDSSCLDNLICVSSFYCRSGGANPERIDEEEEEDNDDDPELEALANGTAGPLAKAQLASRVQHGMQMRLVEFRKT